MSGNNAYGVVEIDVSIRNKRISGAGDKNISNIFSLFWICAQKWDYTPLFEEENWWNSEIVELPPVFSDILPASGGPTEHGRS